MPYMTYMYSYTVLVYIIMYIIYLAEPGRTLERSNPKLCLFVHEDGKKSDLLLEVSDMSELRTSASDENLKLYPLPKTMELVFFGSVGTLTIEFYSLKAIDLTYPDGSKRVRI